MSTEYDPEVIQRTKWYSQVGHAQPIYILTPGVSGMTRMQEVVGAHFGRLIIFCKHGLTQWELDEAHLLSVANHFLGRFQRNHEYLADLYQSWRQLLLVLHAYIDEINQQDHQQAPAEDIISSFSTLYRRLLDSWDHFIFIDAFDPHGDRLLRAHLAAEGVDIAEADLRVLLQATRLSYVAEQRLDLLRIAADQGPDLRSRLAQHQQQYYWIHNNYGHIRYLPIEVFEAQLQQVLDERSSSDISTEIRALEDAPGRVRAAQTRLAREYALSAQTAALLQVFSRLTEIRDERKAMSMRAITAQRHLLQHLAERVEVDVSTLECLAPWEVPEVAGRSREELTALRERRRGYLWYFIDKDNMISVSGRDARDLIEQIDAARAQRHAGLKGMVANMGKAQGHVRKIVTVAEFASFQEGEILVTPMTRPEFSPVIKKAAALVTDEGGVTCHAAVISREYNKPCIIGTRVATKVLKNGDYIEVDADTGVIRRLDRSMWGAASWPQASSSSASPPPQKPTAGAPPSPPQKTTAGTPLRSGGSIHEGDTSQAAILFLDEVEANDLMRVGGKGANLARMYSEFPIPQGFVITTDVFRTFIAPTLREWSLESFHDPATAEHEALHRLSTEAQRLVLAAPIDASVVAQLDAALDRLRGSAFAVRSSAVAEDLATASSAGQLETFLEVPRHQVVECVRRCWTSLYSPHAVDYRLHQGFGHDVDMAVVVQEMVDADLSGVMFTLDPIYREYVLIEVVPGLGEKLVSGEVSPCTFMLNRATFEIEDENLVSGPVATALQGPSFRETTLPAIARLGRKIEQHYGQPQDVEFSLKDGNIFILQSRPITSL